MASYRISFHQTLPLKRSQSRLSTEGVRSYEGKMKQKPYVLILLALFFPLSLWQIWEPDVFWLIRCGEHLLQGQWQCSQTEALEKAPSLWMNRSWLSEALYYAANQLGGIAGLVSLRGLFVLFFMTGSWVLLKIHLPKASDWFILGTLPLLFVASAFELQLGPKLLTISFFPWLLVAFSFARQRVLKALAAILLSLVGLNLVFPILSEIPSASLWIQQLQSYALGSARQWSFSTASLVLTTVVVLLFMQRRLFWRLKSNRFYLFFFALFMVLASVEQNLIPVLLVSSLPLFGSALQRFQMLSRSTFSGVFFLILWLIFLPLATLNSNRSYGFSLNQKAFPILSIDFLQRTKVEGPLLHDPKTGSYMHYARKDDKVFVDTRDFIFKQLSQKVERASRNPEQMDLFLQEYDFKALLLPIQLSQIQNGRLVDVQSIFFRHSEWKVVFFEDFYFLALKNVPENQKLIEAYQYKFLRPHRPPFVNFSEKDRAQKAQIGFEIDRCLGGQPNHLFCQASELFWLHNFEDSPEVTLKIQSLILQNKKLKKYLKKLIPVARSTGDRESLAALRCWVHHICP